MVSSILFHVSCKPDHGPSKGQISLPLGSPLPSRERGIGRGLSALESDEEWITLTEID